MRLREKIFKSTETVKQKNRQTDFIPSGPLVVLEGKKKAVLYDCRRILHYAPDELLLLCKKERVRVVGKDLYCAAFSCGTLTLHGKIDSVSFLPEESL